jgi:hypothetical protein
MDNNASTIASAANDVNLEASPEQFEHYFYLLEDISPINELRSVSPNNIQSSQQSSNSLTIENSVNIRTENSQYTQPINNVPYSTPAIDTSSTSKEGIMSFDPFE